MKIKNFIETILQKMNINKQTSLLFEETLR